jgi:asparagine synthetase B (glutamine-hydrolysing)
MSAIHGADRFRGIAGGNGDDVPSPERLGSALAAEPGGESVAVQAMAGAVLAVTGPAPARRGDAICAIDGRLDGLDRLAAALGVSPEEGPELLVLRGWERWGPDVLDRLDGDFAVALWDAGGEVGMLARDRLGARAIHWAKAGGGGIVFGSEVRTVLRLLRSTPGPRKMGVLRLIVNQQQEPGETLYSGVHRVDPGERVDFGRAGARGVRWWTPRYVAPMAITQAEAVEQVRPVLERAVAKRIPAAGGVGITLSGGLDSASLAALAAEAAPGRTAGFTATFPDFPDLDEAGWVDEIVEHVGIPSVRSAAGADGGMVRDAGIWTAETALPSLGWGDFWVAPLWRRARESGIRVMLTGDGGDELFGLNATLIADELRRGRVRSAFGLVSRLPGAGDATRRELLSYLVRAAPRPLVPRGVRRARARAQPTRALGVHWLGRDATRLLVRASDPWDWSAGPEPLWWRESRMQFTRQIEGVGIFDDTRLRGKRYGIVAQQPLFDREIVELVLRLPPQHFFDAHRSRPLMRAAIGSRLPDRVRLRADKSRFDPVIIGCLAGGDRGLVQTLLGSRDSEIGAYVDADAVRRRLLDPGPDNYAQGPFRWALHSWRLVSAEIWLRSLRDRGRLDDLLDAAPRPSARLL